MTPPTRTVQLTGIAVLLLAVAARLSRAFAVIQGDEVVPLDGDSLRHLSRMQAAAGHGLQVPSFDPWVNWPHGAFEPWAPGFDVVGALLMLPFGANSNAGKLAACLLPVILGVGLVALTAKVAQRLELGPFAGWSAALVVAFAPQLVVSSLFGRTDHHVWEACSLLALALWVLTPVQGSSLRHELVGAVLIFLSMWGFDGAPLYVALITLALAVGVLTCATPRVLGSGVLALAVGGAASALSYAPAMLQHHSLWTYKRPSLLQPLLIEFAAVGLALVVLACTRAGSGMRRRGLAVTFAAVVLALLALALPPLRREVLAGLEEWLAKSDPWLASIAEFAPMLAAPHGFSQLTQSFGFWAWSVPVLFPLGIWLVIRARAARGVQWAVLATGAFGLSLLQMRFGRVAIPFAVITCMVAAVELTRRFRAPLAPALFLILVMLDGRTIAFLIPSAPEQQKPIVELSLALRRLEPLHAGRGVLANWEDGHFVESLSQHPVLVNGFGSFASPEGYELSRTAWTRSQDEMERLFQEKHLGWWIDGAWNFVSRKQGERTVFTERNGKRTLEGQTVRDWPLTASLFGGSGDVGRRVPHLAHFWPRAASTSRAVDIGVRLPDLWLFERVEGAVIDGRATPGSVVSATLVLEGEFPYTAWVLANDEGEYALTLPIPARWSLVVGGVATELVVSENEVRRGTHLAP